MINYEYSSKVWSHEWQKYKSLYILAATMLALGLDKKMLEWNNRWLSSTSIIGNNKRPNWHN